MSELNAIRDFIAVRCGWTVSIWKDDKDASRMVIYKKPRKRMAVAIVFPDGKISIRKISSKEFKLELLSIYDGHLGDPKCFISMYMALMDYNRNC
jgi:hypothetical protein